MSFDSAVVKNAPTACKGILTSVGMCGSVIAGVAIGLPALSPFAAFGSLLAMSITPRHGATAKIMGALAGCIFLLVAASLSRAIAGYKLLALLFLFILSWLAALPDKQLAYLGFVAKFAAVAVLLSFFDFTPSLLMAAYFCGGILFGIFLSLANMAFEKEDQESPLEELRELLHGARNNIYFTLIIPVTVVISTLLAEMFTYSEPAWVGLTVIFVANANITLEFRRLLDRIAGTIAGAFMSYLVISHSQQPLQLALIVGILAFFIPFAVKHYSVFSFLMTCIVLILIDIAMFSQGGAMDLLFWRCIDTVSGCVCVLVSNIILALIYRAKKGQAKIKQ